jgi:DNA-binding GntR family transcriptional regulator
VAKSQTAKIYRRLRREILSKTWSFDGVSSIGDVAKKLKVRVNVVQQALPLLIEEDLLTLATNQRIRPRAVSYPELREAVALRVMIDCLSAMELRARAHSLPAEKMQELTAIHDQLDELVRDGRADAMTVIDKDWEFHRKMVELAGYEVAIPLLRKLHHRILIVAPSILEKRRWESLLGDHKMILDHIQWGPSDLRLCSAIKVHLMNGVRDFFPDIEIFLENDIPDVFSVRSNGHVHSS